jgi:hypothetical protein
MYPNEEKIFRSQALMACETVKSQAYEALRRFEAQYPEFSNTNTSRIIEPLQGFNKKSPKKVVVIVK